MQKQLLTAMAALCITIAAVAQPTTTGLVFYLPLDGNFNNSVSGGAVVTPTGAITPVANTAGTANAAMSFVNPFGTNSTTQSQYATVAINPAINFAAGANFTVAHFFKVNNLPTSGGSGFFDNQFGFGQGYGTWCWRSGTSIQINFNCRNASLGTSTATTPINFNTWYHVAVTRTGTTLAMYINGVLAGTRSDGTVTPAYTSPARIGTQNYQESGTGTQLFYNGLDGALDELRIYNRALTPTEITALANFTGALPVKLTHFTAVKNCADINLNWQTQYEQNSSHFNIERSTDGINFTTIGTVQAKGNAAYTSNYVYADMSLKNITINKAVFYRLRQFDKDGRSEMSSTVTVKYETADALLTLLQNPAQNEVRLQVSLNKKETVRLTITDAQGRTVAHNQINMLEGQTFAAIPVKGLAAATYYITITAGAQKQTVSFIKQ